MAAHDNVVEINFDVVVLALQMLRQKLIPIIKVKIKLPQPQIIILPSLKIKKMTVHTNDKPLFRERRHNIIISEFRNFAVKTGHEIEKRVFAGFFWVDEGAEEWGIGFIFADIILVCGRGNVTGGLVGVACETEGFQGGCKSDARES